MTMTVYILLLFWAFVTGFLLGLNFPIYKPFPLSSKKQIKTTDNGNLSAINDEYRNFLSYDGTRQ